MAQARVVGSKIGIDKDSIFRLDRVFGDEMEFTATTEACTKHIEEQWSTFALKITADEQQPRQTLSLGALRSLRP